MVATPTDDPPDFRPLSAEECLERLTRQQVGRVAWMAPDGPQVLPVNYAWHAGEVVFRVAPYGVLAQLVRPQPAAFEIDEVDPLARSGWSVQVRGQARGLRQSWRLHDLWASRTPAPWAVGSRPLFIAISPETVTGRLVRAF